MDGQDGETEPQVLHSNPWFSVRLRDGYFTIEHHLRQVVVLPLVDRRSAVMVRVPRPVLGATTLELPAGSAEEGETPAEGAARELLEETGIAVDPQRLVPLPSIAVMPNRTPDLVYVFSVELSQREYDWRVGHDAEISEVDLVPLDGVAGMIADGQIYLALPLAVLSSFLLNRRANAG